MRLIQPEKALKVIDQAIETNPEQAKNINEMRDPIIKFMNSVVYNIRNSCDF